MSCEVEWHCKFFVALVALVWSDLVMNGSHMLSQLLREDEALATELAYQALFLFMNSCDVEFQFPWFVQDFAAIPALMRSLDTDLLYSLRHQGFVTVVHVHSVLIPRP